MKWTCFTIHTTEQAEEAVSAILYALGIPNIEVQDNQPVFGLEAEGDYPELYPDLPEDDGSAEVKFYLNLDPEEENTALENSGTEIAQETSPWNRENLPTLLDELRLRIDGLRTSVDPGPGTITTEETREEDWENNWKSFFHGFTIGDLRIEPTWEEDPDMKDADKLLRIDPGLAFGTGAHETTRLVIQQIQKYLKPGDQVLDVGCGSGILSVVSLLYGADHVTATDIDPLCEDAVAENFSNNHLEKGQADLYIGDLTVDQALQKQVGTDRYDVICANILTDILIPMAPALYRALKSGGLVLTSGIIDGREEDVSGAFQKAGFVLVEKNRLGDWWNVTLRKQ